MSIGVLGVDDFILSGRIDKMFAAWDYLCPNCLKVNTHYTCECGTKGISISPVLVPIITTLLNLGLVVVYGSNATYDEGVDMAFNVVEIGLGEVYPVELFDGLPMGWSIDRYTSLVGFDGTLILGQCLYNKPDAGWDNIEPDLLLLRFSEWLGVKDFDGFRSVLRLSGCRVKE